MSQNRKEANEPTNATRSLLHAEQSVPTTLQRLLLLALLAWRRLIEFFAVIVMGIPDQLWRTGLVGTPLGHRIVFDGVAVVVSSLAVALAATFAAYQLLTYTWYAALMLGVSTGGGLFLIDRHMLRLRYQTAVADWRFRLLIGINRLAVLLLMFALAIFSAVSANREAIEADLVKQHLADAEFLTSAPRYKPQLDAARRAVEIASKAMARRAELQTIISEKAQQYEVAHQEYYDECQGNESDGRSRVVGCGPRARAAHTRAIALNNQIAALQAELAATGSANDLASATKTLARLEKEIRDEAEKTSAGLPVRLKTLFHLLETDWSARASVLPWLSLTLVPEALLWVSFTRKVDPALHRLDMIASEVVDAEFEAYRRAQRDRLGQRLPPLIVHAASPPGQRPVLKAVNV